MSFQHSLSYGKAGESAIARWLRGRGCTVLPVYEKIMDFGKGPTLFLPDDVLIAPDMLVFKSESAWWIEAKHKTAFSWYRIGQRWVTGIDLRHYQDYLRVDDATPWPVWLLFLHRGGQAKDSLPSPDGLYGNKLSHLRENESHRSDRHGPSGMVYWGIGALVKMADLEELDELPATQPRIRESAPMYAV